MRQGKEGPDGEAADWNAFHCLSLWFCRAPLNRRRSLPFLMEERRQDAKERHCEAMAAQLSLKERRRIGMPFTEPPPITALPPGRSEGRTPRKGTAKQSVATQQNRMDRRRIGCLSLPFGVVLPCTVRSWTSHKMDGRHSLILSITVPVGAGCAHRLQEQGTRAGRESKRREQHLPVPAWGAAARLAASQRWASPVIGGGLRCRQRCHGEAVDGQ